MKNNGNSIKNLSARTKIQGRDMLGRFLPKTADIIVGTRVVVDNYPVEEDGSIYYVGRAGVVLEAPGVPPHACYYKVKLNDPTTIDEPNPGLFNRSELRML
jgi:hypothetical protein